MRDEELTSHASRLMPHASKGGALAPALLKPYDPAAVERRIYQGWSEAGYFEPTPDPSATPFCIIMPPPNVTGELHLGHALTASIQDLLIRWHRMRGDAALWLPGRDHAGIAGQLVVEREIATEGKTRHDLGRDAFLERMWDWMDRYGDTIGVQHRRLGVSADWDRERFTMDPGPSRAVRTAFVRLFEKGLIYRGARITHWCHRCSTALSDLEVVHFEEPGALTYVNYPLVPLAGENERRFIQIATTRPETILADTGIAVHPEDPRFSDLIGREAIVPSVNRAVPIVGDEAVQREFGTGAVKVTPGHDPTDFEIGQRHWLPTVLVIGPDGHMNADAGPRYEGLLVAEARAAFVEELRALGLLVRQDAHTHQVGHCDRCKTIVEPLVSEQWFVRIAPLAAAALEAVRSGRIRIIPDHFTRVYYNWLENIRDWCISRQLWWGHRIPVWTCANEHVFASVDDPISCRVCGSTSLTQDPDVLDTWFSSGLWPFSTLGWPDDTEDLQRFYPTSVMETGYDILFFWVARMIMLGLEMTGEVPFRVVYLHGLIRVGREKMSKVRGNVLNPLDLIEAYGTDALRLALVSGTTPGNDSQIADEWLETNRNFVNKLWNAGRFVLSNVDSLPARDLAAPLAVAPGASSEADRWIVARANEATAHVTRLLEEYQFGLAAQEARDFLWGEFCDWYVEMAKINLREAASEEERAAIRANLARVFEHTLRILHPMAPFVTEELWQLLRGRLVGEAASRIPASIMVAPWPAVSEASDAEARDRIEALMALVRGVRNVRAEYQVNQARWVPATLVAGDEAPFFRRCSALIGELPGCRLRPVEVVEHLAAAPEHAVTVATGQVTLYMPLSGLVDLDRERARLERERAQLGGEIERAESLLGRPGFVEKAPSEVVAREREKLAALRERAAALERRLRDLG